MKQRGRKKFDSLVIEEQENTPSIRLQAPKDLPKAQIKFWDAVVNQMPADWFGKEHEPLLRQYVQVLDTLGPINAEMAEFKEVPKEKQALSRYKLLARQQSRYQRMLKTYSATMRLTQSAFKKGGTTRAGRPNAEPDYPWTRSAKTPLTGEEAGQWIEKHCRIPEGKHVGKALRLTREQIKWLEAIFDTPTRLFILSVGRKNAKTAFASILLLIFLCGPASTTNGQLYSTAQSKEQAAIIFKYAAQIVRMSPTLAPHVGIRDAGKQLYVPKLGTVYRALSAEVPTSFGLSPVFVVHDELGQVRGPKSELYEALETAGAAQESPLSIVISTQAPTDGDLLSILIDDAASGADPRKKVELYTAPMEMDPFSVEAIRAANPHFDDFMNKEEVITQMKDAQRMPSAEAGFRNYILNQRVESRAPFISREVWTENGDMPAPLAKQELYCGLDLASVSDLCAFVMLTKNGDVYPTFWLPADGLVEKSRADRVPYDIWKQKKLLLTTPGRSVQYEYIAEHLRGIFDRYNVKLVAFDRYNMRFLKPWLLAAGFSDAEMAKFVEFGQGFISMSPAIREVESKLLAKKYRHGNHPVLTMCANNATVVMDPAGNKKFTKIKASGRIDGMVAMTMAEGMMPSGPSEPEKKYQMIFI